LKQKREMRDEKSDRKGKRPMKKLRREEMNQEEEIEEENNDEHIIFTLNESSEITFNNLEEGQFFNFNEPDVNDSSESNPHLLYYNWLTDSATTLHISNQREAFMTLHPLTDTLVSGVGNVKTKAEGWGTVELILLCNSHDYTLRLEDILYIPMNCNNLIALGKWDKSGGQYRGGGALILITKDGTLVAWGTKVENNLYKIKVAICKLNATIPKANIATPQCFVAHESAQSWEIWHKWFGHIGYSRLQHMLDKNIVEGFSIDTHMPKPDCITCTKAKKSVEPFAQDSNWRTKPGDLTHINLWGKYDTASINGNHHYILFVDDSEWYNTTEFLKKKSDAVQKVKDYLAYLISHDKKPKAIHINQGKEFVNKNLMAWCHEWGI